MHHKHRTIISTDNCKTASVFDWWKKYGAICASIFIFPILWEHKEFFKYAFIWKALIHKEQSYRLYMTWYIDST